MKPCSLCRRTLELDEFPMDRGRRYAKCRACKAQQVRLLKKPRLGKMAQLRADLALANEGLAQAEDKIRKLSRTEL